MAKTKPMTYLYVFLILVGLVIGNILCALVVTTTALGLWGEVYETVVKK